MADGVLNDASKAILLDNELQGPPFDVAYVGLGLNDITPTRTTTLLDLAEVAFVGYLRQRLIQGNWSPAIIRADGAAFSVTNPVVFQNLSGSTQGPIRTWFYINQITNALILAGRLDAPVLLADGESYTRTPFWIKKGA